MQKSEDFSRLLGIQAELVVLGEIILQLVAHNRKKDKIMNSASARIKKLFKDNTEALESLDLSDINWKEAVFLNSTLEELSLSSMRDKQNDLK